MPGIHPTVVTRLWRGSRHNQAQAIAALDIDHASPELGDDGDAVAQDHGVHLLGPDAIAVIRLPQRRVFGDDADAAEHLRCLPTHRNRLRAVVRLMHRDLAGLQGVTIVAAIQVRVSADIMCLCAALGCR